MQVCTARASPCVYGMTNAAEIIHTLYKYNIKMYLLVSSNMYKGGLPFVFNNKYDC